MDFGHHAHNESLKEGVRFARQVVGLSTVAFYGLRKSTHHFVSTCPKLVEGLSTLISQKEGMAKMARILGIRHRVKSTVEGEARPTQIVIWQDGQIKALDLKTEADELDFVLSKFPVSFRAVQPDENTGGFQEHHIIWRTLKEDQPDVFPANLVRRVGKSWQIATRVPSAYDGLQSGDVVVMLLGGSGDNLAYALARRGEKIGARVMRIPPSVFSRDVEQVTAKRGRDEDATHLIHLYQKAPGLFYKIRPRDMQLIRLRECLRARIDAMKARIACEQRLRQHMIGQIFCSPDGLYPEGSIEKQFDQAKANDTILQVLIQEEKRRERELVEACKALDIYQKLFVPIEGCGPMIASRIIASIVDIRRFPDKYKLRAFCGVHVLPDGSFPRRRNNQPANWDDECRSKALYLLGGQFNRRPDSVWGQRLLRAKDKYRTAHPKVVEQDGKKRYYPGHVHNMALWYTLGKFVQWLYGRWWALERETEAQQKAASNS